MLMEIGVERRTLALGGNNGVGEFYFYKKKLRSFLKGTQLFCEVRI